MENQKLTVEELTERWLKTPIRSGDIFYDQEGNKFSCITSSEKRLLGSYVERKDSRNENIRKEFKPPFVNLYKKAEDYRGVNYFDENDKIQFTNFDLDNILLSFGFNRRDTLEFEDKFGYKGVNFDPFFFVDGQIVYYQRDYVWTLGQKQSLITTIIKGLEAGRIIVKYNSFEYMEKMKAKGFDVAHYDIIDGKQRISTIISFMRDEFPDIYGTFYSQWNNSAKYKFMNYQGLLFGKIEEQDEISASQIARLFVNNASAGTPISEEHIEKMKAYIK